MEKIIDKLALPSGLRSLKIEELEKVCSELRDELIDTVASAGGHFASSLGATEITVALHHIFNTPEDRIVWDVGHQAYIHKMVTGRRAEMPSIRKLNGLSGFLKRSESEYDTFGAGHAGTSISAAVGMAAALRESDPTRHVVAVIGDGSMTAGMAFEALNHAGDLGLGNLIVVLNDNEMSISPNVGAISWLFSHTITTHLAAKARTQFKRLYKSGYVPEVVYRTIDKAEEATQAFFTTPSMLFAAFGFRYIGPVDGHSISSLVTALSHAKEQDVPTLVHISTVKGKGYTYAEEDPIKWHGVTPFCRNEGKFISIPNATKPPPSYTTVFADALVKLCKDNSKVRGITAAMPGGTGLDKLQAEVPEAFVDVGICEQHAVTFAAGLACEGYKPVCAIYSTFLQRAYDQVVHDVAIQNLPVVFAMDRGGVVGNDGETHQGVFDIAFLRTLPNMTIMSPKDENELQHMLYTSVQLNAPVALRYPRGNGAGVTLDKQFKQLEIGKSEIVRQGEDLLFVAFGPVISYAVQAADELATNHGITSTVINARFAKPLDEELLRSELPKYGLICTIEDHAIQGGFGSAVVEFANDEGLILKSAIKRFGVGDEYVPHASQAEQHRMHGYDTKAILEYVLASKQQKAVAA